MLLLVVVLVPGVALRGSAVVVTVLPSLSVCVDFDACDASEASEASEASDAETEAFDSEAEDALAADSDDFEDDIEASITN